MEKTIKGAWRFIMMMLVVALSANVAQADDKVITEEFVNEGIDKAVAVMNDMVTQINELERAEQAEELANIMNSIKFRNVRKKYGKIELTDAYRARLIEANIAVANALKEYLVRAALPYQLQQMLEEQASVEKITEAINQSKTLREAMS